MSFSDLIAFIRTRVVVEEGQTMAEYGVVLAVITIGAVLAFTGLAGDIVTALGKVGSNL